MRLARLFTAIGSTVLLGLAGCEGPAGLALTGASIVSFATTDKFLTDHLLSWARGEDCSTVAAAGGERYCRQEDTADADPSPSIVEAPLYCYRTLAEITCYDAPDPQASPGRLVQ